MIKTRLNVWNALILAFVFAGIGVGVYVSTQRTLYGTLDARLAERVRFLERNWPEFVKNPPKPPPDRMNGRPGPGGPPPPPGDPFPGPDRGVSPEQRERMEFERHIMRPRVILLDGKGFMDPADTPWDASTLPLSFKGRRVFSATTIDDEHVRVLSVPLKDRERVVAVAQQAASLRETDELMDRLRRTLLALLPLALLLTSLTGIYLTHHALRPVREIATTAEKIEATNLGGRLSVSGRDEFAMLGRTFNSMLARLEASFQKLAQAYETQRRFVSDASHELKTPLTAIKMRVGVARRGPQTVERLSEHLDGIEASADTMGVIVQDLLLLARSDENRLDIHPEETVLLDLIEVSVAQARSLGQATVSVDVLPELLVQADRSLLERALTNIVGNALRNTPAVGTVTIRASVQDGQTVLEVVDTGSGIAPEHLTRVFERFYRTETSRDRSSGGTGLGLSIAKTIVEAHGGAIALESQPGKGTTVRIALPR